MKKYCAELKPPVDKRFVDSDCAYFTDIYEVPSLKEGAFFYYYHPIRDKVPVVLKIQHDIHVRADSRNYEQSYKYHDKIVTFKAKKSNRSLC